MNLANAGHAKRINLGLTPVEKGEPVLKVNEMFGPTLQGEGPSSGLPVVFLRLGLCNLACTWCDTPYTWDWDGKGTGTAYDPEQEMVALTIPEVYERLRALMGDKVYTVVISGGEPMMQQQRLIPLVRRLYEAGYDVEVETNGTLLPQPEFVGYVTRFNVSPKLLHSGNDPRKAIKPRVLDAYEATCKAAFKFVVAGDADLPEVEALVEECSLTDVWLMPEGTTPEELLPRLPFVFNAAVERGWCFTPRVHALTFGAIRGV